VDLKPTLSIIIVTWNSARWLPACLRAVATATQALSVDVWLVDNGSADDTIETARRLLPGANIIANTCNLGFAQANNQALAQATGDFLLLLNPDTEVNAQAITGMIEIMRSQSDVGLVGCRLAGANGQPQECYGLTYPGVRNLSPAIRPGPGHPELLDAAWLGGACLMARREAVEAVGGLDSDYLMYYEDVDWGLRMRCGGWRVGYWDGGQVLHHGGGDSAHVPSYETARRYITSEMVFHSKHTGGLRRTAVWAARFLRALRGIIYYGLLRGLGSRDPAGRYDRYRAWLAALTRRSWRSRLHRESRCER
jgi:N-acetylglucosaminyl-diphospho-decaprenol L-rhamnosyltransferase